MFKTLASKKNQFLIRILPFIAVLFLGVTVKLHATIPHGVVRDYNESRKEISVVIPRPGLFLPGQKLSIFRNRTPLGEVQVTQVFHTRIKAKVLQGSRFQRKDLVLKNKSDINRLRKPEINVVSFRSIGNPAHSWIARVAFPGSDAETQTRRVTIANSIGIRVDQQEYYATIKASDIKSLHFRWQDGRLLAYKVMLKNRQTYNCSEILTPYILQRLKPPAVYRKDGQEMVVSLQKQSRPSKSRPDGLQVKLQLEDAVDIFEKSDIILIKAYSTGLFINEFALQKSMLRGENLQTRFEIPGMELFPGENNIEFYMVAAKNNSGDFFESGSQRLIGERKIEYSDQKNKHKFLIVGDGDDLELE